MTISDDVLPTAEVAATSRERHATARHYAMTAPQYFAVEYAINPWMDTSTAVDTERALTQWATLRETYLDLGHSVELVAPRPGLPDMVYAANGGIVIGDTAIVARFAYPQRAAEADAYAEWMRSRGFHPVSTEYVNEGQGDLLLAGSTLLAGWGFRTDVRAHGEIAAATGLPVESLELVDPRFYHLDTALTVLDDTTVAYYPPAFTDAARTRLVELFDDAIEVSSVDAYVLGLNAVSDGRHVVLPEAAAGFAEQLRDAGFEPIGVDLSELLKGGGSIKCCTLELHS
ncbi:arginine deiminase-related protein [Mycobacterium sp. 21AC1]|uniref:dimethylargininase n=1 Tax=[Mycobacterium] appelbergii TaxID=2939269 RepID=UPI002938DFF0|nr:dimethylargininase [Mycobacterium sp. 21AC1]MDV3127628.1 arginine deiminase-related protein [Mycobacterium sp. 21AC1]